MSFDEMSGPELQSLIVHHCRVIVNVIDEKQVSLSTLDELVERTKRIEVMAVALKQKYFGVQT